MKLINLLLILGIVLSLSACSVQEEVKVIETVETFELDGKTYLKGTIMTKIDPVDLDEPNPFLNGKIFN